MASSKLDSRQILPKQVSGRCCKLLQVATKYYSCCAVQNTSKKNKFKIIAKKFKIKSKSSETDFLKSLFKKLFQKLFLFRQIKCKNVKSVKWLKEFSTESSQFNSTSNKNSTSRIPLQLDSLKTFLVIKWSFYWEIVLKFSENTFKALEDKWIALMLLFYIIR